MKSIKIRILIIFLILLGSLICIQWYFINYFIKDTLEKQLINYITDIGKASVKTIKPNMLQIFPGFTETKTFHKLKKDLRKYQTDFNIDNIILMTPEKRVVVDLSGMFKNGDEYLFIDINKRQLVSLQGGHIKSSSLYKNMNNIYCENIYFPIFDKNKDFKGVMILFASAKYFHSLMNFQKKLSYLFVVIIILSGLLLYLLAHSISKPVVQLSKLVDKIGEGELNAAVPYKSRKDEIGRLAKNIKDMMDKIKSKNIFMRRVSAGIAHEIRNPLTAIKGNLMLIKRAINTDPRLLEMVNDNLREVNSLENLVSDFMNYAKSINIELKSVKANDVIERSLQEMQPLLKQKAIKLTDDIPKCRLLADFDYLKRAFVNIIKNSIEAVKYSGEINIIGEIRKGKLYLIFLDNGKGIDEENFTTIFEPFYTSKSAGTGLGLSIVKEIIEKHYGKIELSSEMNKFTKITLILPIEEKLYGKDTVSR